MLPARRPGYGDRSVLAMAVFLQLPFRQDVGTRMGWWG